MELRVKCKCGKSLKIPDSLAGKKVGCPGCKKIYRIPAERFQTAGAEQVNMPRPVAALARAAAPANSAAEIDSLISPGDIDITPSELDLLGDLGQSSNDLISNALAGPTKPCPNCQAAMAETAVLCTHCGYNSTTGKQTKSKALAGASKAKKAAKAAGGFVLGTVFSGIGAAIGGTAWFLVVWYANYEVGYVAWGIGLLAGFGMKLASQSGVKAGVTAATMSALGIVGAKFAVFMFIMYAMVTGDTSNIEMQRQYVIGHMADEILDERGINGEKQREEQWESATTEAEKKVEAMGDQRVRELWKKYRDEEAAVAEGEDFIAAVTTKEKGKPDAAGLNAETQTAAADEGADISVSDFMGAFFQSMFGAFDLLWGFLALGTAFKMGKGGLTAGGA